MEALIASFQMVEVLQKLDQTRTKLLNDNISIHQADAIARIYFSVNSAHIIAAVRHSTNRASLQQKVSVP